MTPQQDLYALLTAVLPVLGIILPGILKTDKLSDQRNSIITFVILLVFGGAQAWSTNKLTGLNPWLDFAAIEAAMASILAGPFAPVDEWLQGNIGITGTKSAPTATPQSVNIPTPPPPSGASQPPS